MLGINLSITGENSKLQASLKEAGEKVKDFGREVSVSLKEFLKANIYEKAFEKLTEAIGEPFEKLKGAFEMGAQLQLLHNRTGAGIKDLMLLQEAFKQSGLGAEEVGPAINKMQKALSGVNEEGGDTTSIFNRLGLDPKKLGLQDAGKQIKAIGEKINALPTATQRASAAMQVFGKTGGQMLALFGNKGVLDRAAQNLGSQAGILARDAALFHEISGYLESSGNKIKGFFVGIADTIGPSILPLLEWFNTLDFAKWGQEIGNAVAIPIQAFGDGTLMELLGSAIKLGAMKGLNFLDHLLKAVFSAIPDYLSWAFGNMADDFSILTTEQFWSGLVNVLAGAATKFGAYMLDALAAPIAYLQAGMENAMQKVSAGSDADVGAKQLVLESAQNTDPSLLADGGAEGIKEKARRVAEAQAAVDAAIKASQPEESFASIYQRRLKEAPEFFGMQSGQLSKLGDSELKQGGADLAPMIKEKLAKAMDAFARIGDASRKGFSGPDAFDTSKEQAALGGMLAKLQEHVDAGKKDALANAGESNDDSAGDLEQKAKVKVVASSLARIGGGGNYAGGAAGLQREANGLLRKLVANTTGLKTGGLGPTPRLQTAPVFAV